MSESPETPSPEEILLDLRGRAEALERQLATVQQDAEARLVRTELKVEAMRAGIIDIDGLKLADCSSVKLNDRGDVEGAVAVVARLKRDKPWLFAGASSSSRASPPLAQPPRQKLATEMTDAEYRAARADILKRRF
jgi:hypothetical protein